MNKQLFTIEGFEILQKRVTHYKGSASRVLVPKTWKGAILIRVE